MDKPAGSYPNIEATEFVAIQVTALSAAVRALIATHPEPDRVRAVFDQLLGQMQANPAYLGHPEKQNLLKSLAELLFRPPIEL
jgi:hypothetical protein